MSKESRVYERFMKSLEEDKILVVVFLVNGVKLQGFIEDFDEVSIILKREQNVQLLYKHAVSTIVPQKEG